MMSDLGRMIDIIEDRSSLELGLRMILDANALKKLPPYGSLPTFSDSVTEELFVSVLEAVVGERYPN